MKNDSENKVPGVFCLVGATGTGKTAAALTLAEYFPISVVNADSRQVYRDLPIVTAQPSPEEHARCPHRLYGFLELQESISAGSFAKVARPELEDCRQQGGIPVLVGGTGLYLRALSGGLAAIPQVTEDVRRDVLHCCMEHGPEVLHAELEQIDPAYAARIHPRDKQRVTRALEVFKATGKPLSWWHVQPGTKVHCKLVVVGLRMPRAELHGRLAQRIDHMLEMGAVEEVMRAWNKCPRAEVPGFSGIGCKELLDFLKGDTTLEQAKEKWLLRTRAYARRQETWFNNTPGVHWLTPGDDKGLFEAFRGFME